MSTAGEVMRGIYMMAGSIVCAHLMLTSDSGREAMYAFVLLTVVTLAYDAKREVSS